MSEEGRGQASTGRLGEQGVGEVVVLEVRELQLLAAEAAEVHVVVHAVGDGELERGKKWVVNFGTKTVERWWVLVVMILHQILLY